MNRIATSIIGFDDEINYISMQDAIRNCINKPLEYQLINYISKDEVTIFTAEYLKNSLISWTLTTK